MGASTHVRAGYSVAVPVIVALVLLITCTRQMASPMTAPCPEGGAPDVVVCHFYQKIMDMRLFGLPTPSEQEALAPYLSLGLQRLLDDARTYQEDYATRHPEDKPPFVDGSLFTSLFEGASTFHVTRTEAMPDGDARVFVRFSYEGSVEWEDSAEVIREQDRYVIDDILLSGAGQFNPGGRLSETLRWREESRGAAPQQEGAG